VVLPGRFWYNPMMQSWHAALRLEPTFGFFFPAAHLLHLSGLVKPVAEEYVPCGHPMQKLLETAPISVEYNPAGHSVVFFEQQGYRCCSKPCKEEEKHREKKN
jgi:hypothetical protein